MGDMEVSWKFEIHSISAESDGDLGDTTLLFYLVIPVSVRDAPKHLNKNILSQKEK